MSDLRIIGRSEDGTELILESSDGSSFSLRISDHLKSLVNQPRLVAVPTPEEEIVVSAKEVQARLRGGESADSIARTTDWSVEKIEKFAGPIMQERAYIIGIALNTGLRKEKHAPTLMTATISQLSPRGVDMSLVEWNTWRMPDGSWNIILMYPTKDGSLSEGNWSFDLNNRTLEPLDDNALWISGQEREAKPSVPSHGIVYPPSTPAPRLVSVREDTLPHSTSGTSSPSSESNQPPLPKDLDEADRRDGVTKRLKIPSWDDIMFGGSKKPSEEE